MTTSSARPDKLRVYVTDGAAARADLSADITALRACYDQFQASGSITVANPDLMDAQLPNLVTLQQNDEDFVAAVEQAFRTADGGEGEGLVTADTDTIDTHFDTAAAAAGYQPDELEAVAAPLTVAEPVLGAVPRTSGFVDDPVCTGSGFLVEDTTDLPMPPRLVTLEWRRVYSSGVRDEGGHGRGWSTWAEVRLEALPGRDDRFTWLGPDAQRLLVIIDAATGEGRVPGLDATVTRTTDGALLRWDVDADDRASQRWHFAADGRLVRIDDPAAGSTTFTHTDGRLVRVAHEGGRNLTVAWDGDRIATVASSDGRRVTYAYDADGDLCEVDRPEGRLRIGSDDLGRIETIVDADGVRLCANTYDDQDRVVAQVSPFGRDVRFRYLPGRRTEVSDTAGGPRAVFEHDAQGRLVALTPAADARFRRTFDARGRVTTDTSLAGRPRTITTDDGCTTITEADGTEVRRWRDYLGRITREVTPTSDATLEYEADDLFPARVRTAQGGVTELAWDRGQLSSVVDADGVRIDIDIDPDGVGRALRDGLGAVTRIEPHPSGEPARVTYADGTSSTIERDDAGRIVSITDPVGSTMTFERSPAGRVTAIVDPLGARTGLTYAPSGALEEAVDPLGRSTAFDHDALERLVGIRAPGGGRWRYAHTVIGRVERMTDPTGATWRYAYDPDGRVTSHTDAEGRTHGVTYDMVGRPIRFVDPGGNRTTVEIGPDGLPESIVDAAGGVHQRQWAGPGRPSVVVDPDGVTTRIEHTAAGRVRRTQTDAGPVVEHRYDPCGRLVALVTDPDGAALTRRYEHDARGRLVAEEDPGGRRLEHHLDASGRLIGVTAGGWSWTYRRDAAGRVVESIDPLGSHTRYAYDPAGQVTSVTDPRGSTVSYRYDADGHLVEVVDPFGRPTRAERDALGRIVAMTDALGRTTRRHLDATGRERRRDLPDGSHVAVELDACGRVSDVWADGRPVAAYERDALGRVTSAHEPAVGRTVDTAWTAGGRLARQVDERGSLEWTYDRAGRRTGRAGSDGHRVAWRWDEVGALAATEVDGRPVGADDQTVERVHDDRDLLVAVVRAGADGERLTTTLERDGAGRIVRIVEPDGAITTYTYDEAGQLVAESGPDGERRWTYDLAGRRISEDGDRGSWRWTYDDAGQLARIDGPDGATIVDHDDCGRRSREVGPHGERRFTWDALGRLTSIERDGRRVAVDVSIDGTLRSVGDHHLRWDPTGPIDELATLDGRAATAGRVVLDADGGPAVTDWRGSLVATDAWGVEAVDIATDPDDVHLGFLGEVGFGGLVWLRRRALDPSTAQMLSLDPLVGTGGSPVATNGYHYAANDPLGQLDPLGLAPVSIEQFNAVREQATSVQWGAIAQVGIAVVGTVVIVASAGTLSGPAVIAMGAAFGAMSGAAPGVAQGVQTGHWDWAGITKGAVIGGVTGAATAGLPVRYPGLTGTMPASIAYGGASGGGSAMVGEGYDVIPGAPGADGSFDWDTVAVSTATGAGTGALDFALTSATATGPPAQPGIEMPPPPAGWSTTDAGLYVPPASPAVPPPPTGWTTTPSGIHVPPGAGGLATPPPPSGWTTTPSGLMVPG